MARQKSHNGPRCKETVQQLLKSVFDVINEYTKFR